MINLLTIIGTRPQPDYNLGIGSGNHGEQTAKMIEGIEKVLTGKLIRLCFSTP